MKKEIYCRDRERIEYRPEPKDRLSSRPTFDPSTGQIVFPMYFFADER